MPTLPAELLPLIVEFQPLFSRSVWKNAQTLLAGAILALGSAPSRLACVSWGKAMTRISRIIIGG